MLKCLVTKYIDMFNQGSTLTLVRWPEASKKIDRTSRTCRIHWSGGPVAISCSLSYCWSSLWGTLLEIYFLFMILLYIVIKQFKSLILFQRSYFILGLHVFRFGKAITIILLCDWSILGIPVCNACADTKLVGFNKAFWY